MAFNQSKVKMWRRCQKQYAFRYDYSPEGKELVPKVSKVQLERGTWLHALIQAHFEEEAGLEGDWQEVHDELTGKFNSIFDEEKEELGDLPGECLRIFKAYLRFWNKSDEGRYVTATLPDGESAIEFVVEAELPGGEEFKGRIDRVVEDTEFGGLWIWDHKWVKTIPDSDERIMSPQAPMYIWGCRENGLDVRGFVNNYGRTKAPTIPNILKRPAGAVSQKRNMDTDLYTYCTVLKEQYGEDWQAMAKTVYAEQLRAIRNREQLWFRRERFPVEDHQLKQALSEFLVSINQIAQREDKENAPRSYFYNCKFNCEYHMPCVAEYQLQNIKPILKSKFRLVGERYADEEAVERDLLSG